MMHKKWNWALLPAIWSLAWPTMLEQLLQTSVQYIDTAMVGALGTAATAAVGSTGTLNWLINGTIAALGVGFLAYIAKAGGAGDEKSVSKAASQTVLAVLLCALCSMHSVGSPLAAPLAPPRRGNPDILIRLPMKCQKARAFFAKK